MQQNFLTIANRLRPPELPGANLSEQLKVAAEIRDHIEILHSSHYAGFLTALFPIFQAVLTEITPVFMAGDENKLRNLVLEICHRLPTNDVLRPYVKPLVKLTMDVLVTDNEQNATVCIKILFDLHKVYKPTLEAAVQPFLNFVISLYERMEGNVEKAFSPDAFTAPTILIPGKDSFKVLTECPLIVMLLFQLYTQYIPANVEALIPLMIKALTVRVSLPPDIPLTPEQEQKHVQVLACQVKTLSFLTYLVRTMPYAEAMREYETTIASSVVELLQTCPPSAVATRKELLVATRHILATDFRNGFFPHIDVLVNEEVLLGGSHWKGASKFNLLAKEDDSVGAQPLLPFRETQVQPLAYSTLADLVHHVRTQLKLPQLSKVIYLFSRNINDNNLPISIQTTSVRLLLNLVDNIFHNNEAEPDLGRKLLVQVFHTLVTKIGSLRYMIPQVMQKEVERVSEHKRDAKDKVEGLDMYYFVHQAAQDNARNAAVDNRSVGEIYKVEINSTSALDEEKHRWKLLDVTGLTSPEPDGLKEIRALLNTMILGLKTVLWCVSNYGKKKLQRQERQRQTSQSANKADGKRLPKNLSGLLSSSEMDLVSSLLTWGLQCMPIYRKNSAFTIGEEKTEEPEVLQHFAGIFTVLDPHDFTDLMRAKFGFVYANILRHPTVMAFAKALMRNVNVSRYFVTILMKHVLDNIHRLPGIHAPQRSRYGIPRQDFNETFAPRTTWTFNDVPKAGKDAALSLEGLGLLPTARLGDIEEPEHENEPAVLAQLCDTMFAALAMYSDDPVDSIPTPRPDASPPRSTASSSTGVGASTSASVGAGAGAGASGAAATKAWGITRILRVHFENLLIYCLTLAADMTSSSQVSLRHAFDKGVAKLGTMRSVHLGTNCYVMILKGMLGVVARRPKLQMLFQPQVQQLIPAALSALCKLLKQSQQLLLASGQTRAQLVSEVVLLFTARIPRNDLSHYFTLLQEPLEVAISAFRHGNGELTRLALRVLESWVDHLNAEELESLLLMENGNSNQGNRTFGHTLVQLIEPSPSQFGTVVLRILGKLGPRIRRAIHSVAEAEPDKDLLPSQAGFSVELLWKPPEINQRIDVSLGVVVHEAYDYMFDLYKPATSKLCAKPIPTPVSDFEALPNSVKEVNLKCRSEKMELKKFFVACVAQLITPSCSESQIDPKLRFLLQEQEESKMLKHGLSQLHFVQESGGEDSKAREHQRRAEREVMVFVLKGLFLLACDNDIHDSQDLLASLTRFFTVHALSWTVKAKAEARVFIYNSLSNGDKEATVPVGEGIDGTVINQVIVEMISAACPVVSTLALKLIGVIGDVLSSVLDLSDINAPMHCGSALVDDLVERFALACQRSSWASRLGGVSGLRKLIQVLPEASVRLNEARLMRIYLRTLENFSREQGAEVLLHASDGLYELVERCHHPQLGPAAELGQREKVGGLLKLLLHSSISPSPEARSVSHKALEQLSGKYGLSSGAFLCQFPVIMGKLRRTLFSRSIRGRSRDSQVAILETLAHILALRPCPFDVFSKKNDAAAEGNPAKLASETEFMKRLAQTLADVVVLADLNDISKVYYNYAQCISDSPRCAVSKLLNTLNTPNCVYAGRYHFREVPYHPRLREVSVRLITALLEVGGEPFHAFITSMERTSKVLEKAVALVLNTCTSTWSAARRTGHEVLPLLAKLSGVNQPIAAASGSKNSGAFKAVIPGAVVEKALEQVIQDAANQGTLSAPFLQGVMHLVSNFAPSSAISVGNRLADHLGKLMETSNLPRGKPDVPDPSYKLSGGDSWERGDESLLAMEIVRVYVGLPESVARFLDEIITRVVRVQLSPERLSQEAVVSHKYDQRLRFHRIASSVSLSGMHGYLSSPVLQPLSDFLGRFPEEAFKFFFSQNRLANRNFSALFLQVVRLSPQVREVLTRPAYSELFIRATLNNHTTLSSPKAAENPTTEALHKELVYQGMRLLEATSALHPNWLIDNRNVYRTVRNVWRSRMHMEHLERQEAMVLEHRGLSRLCCNAFMGFFISSYHHKDPPNGTLGDAIQGIFEMLTIACLRTSEDNSFLKRFYNRHVARNPRLDVRKAVITYYLALVRAPDAGMDIKEAALRLIVLPTLSHTYREGKTPVLTFTPGYHLECLIREIIESPTQQAALSGTPLPPSPATSGSASRGSGKQLKVAPPRSVFMDTASTWESCQMQLLLLSTTLIAHCGKELMEFRKELIKYAWNHLKGDDTSLKECAYLSICTFIDVYPTPPDIILQVYIALLKEHSCQSPAIVNRAMDLITPALPRRLSIVRYIRAIKLTKRLMYDEGHRLPQLNHIWQLIQRHARIFYQFRGQFIPQLVNCLNRLGLPHNSTVENRRIALGLCRLFLVWEKTRVAEAAQSRSSKSPKGRSPKRRKLELLSTFSAQPLVEPSVIEAFASRDALEGFKANDVMYVMVIHFLMRLSLILATNNKAKAMYAVSMRLYKEALAEGTGLLRIDPPAAQHKRSRSEVDTALRTASQHGILRFSYIAKHLTVIAAEMKKKNARAKEAKKSSSKKTDAKEEHKPPANGLECVLELFKGILRAGYNQFIVDNCTEMNILIGPCLNCVDTTIRGLFMDIISLLVRRFSPMDSSSPLVANLPNGPSGKPFYPALVQGINHRLLLNADDGKTAVQQVSVQIQEMKKKEKGTKQSRPQSQSKAAQQKAARARALQSAREQGAGPLGTIANLKLIQTLCKTSGAQKYSSTYVDKFLTALVRLASKLAKELIAAATSRLRIASKFGSGSEGNIMMCTLSHCSVEDSHDETEEALMLCLELVTDRVLFHEKHRWYMLQLMNNLMEKLDAHCMATLALVVKIIGIWLARPMAKKGKLHPALSLEERTLVLGRLKHVIRFFGIPGSYKIVDAFHDLVLRVYESHGCADSAKRPKWIDLHMHKMFFSGLTSLSRDHRERYHKAFNTFGLTGKGLFSRLNLVMELDVNYMSHTYWIPAALNIVLSSVALSFKAKTPGVTQDKPFVMAPINMPTRGSTGPHTPGDRHQRLLTDVKKVLMMLNSSTTSASIMTPLLNLVHLDGSRRLAETLWIDVFPRIWNLFSDDQRVRLSLTMQKFLANCLHKSQRNIVSEAIQSRIIQMKKTSNSLATMVTAELKSEKIYGTTIDPYLEVLMCSSIKRVQLWQRASRRSRKSVVITVLKGVRACNPMPLIGSELLSFVATKHAAPHLVLHIGEEILSQKAHELNVASRLKKAPSPHVMEYVRNFLAMLTTVYGNMLQTSDMYNGLQRLQSSSQVTLAGLSFEAIGQWDKAQNVYFSGLSNVKLGNGVYLSPRKRGGLPHSQLKQFAEFDDASGEYSKMMPMSPEALVWKQEEVPQQEVDRWEQRWCECARMLGQWEDLNQIVTDKGDLPGMLESACRTPLADWARVREVLETMYNANQDVSSRICLYQVCLAVQECQTTSDVDILWRKAANLTLLDAATFTGNLEELLVLFQRLTEIEDSVRLYVEVNSLTNTKDDRKQADAMSIPRLLRLWRSRLPSEVDSVSIWDDILVWRTQLFHLCVSSFKQATSPKASNGESSSAASILNANMSKIHDEAWTTLQLSRAYRKRGMTEYAGNVLDRLWTYPSLGSQHKYSILDSFLRTSEHSLLCLEAAKSAAHVESRIPLLQKGLEIASTVDIKDFPSPQRAELFRIKAAILQSAGEQSSVVHENYITATQLCEKHGQSWLSWGRYIESLESKPHGKEGSSQSMAAVVVATYLQAIASGEFEARFLLPKILWMLHIECDQGAQPSSASSGAPATTLSTVVIKFLNEIPTWLWLPWIPQLISGLSKGEAQVAVRVLLRIVKEFPQALYYPLRAEILEQQKQRLKKQGSAGVGGDSSSPKGGSSPPPSPQSTAKDVITKIHQLHPCLALEAEVFLEEIQNGFKKQRPIDEIHSAIQRLLNKSLQVATSVTSAITHVLEQFGNNRQFYVLCMLRRVCDQFFSEKSMQRSKDHLFVLSAVRNAFETDFRPPDQLIASFRGGKVAVKSSPTDKFSIAKIVQRLSKWKRGLDNLVYTQKANTIPLEKYSEELLTMSYTVLEVPGQYLLHDGLSKPHPGNHNILTGVYPVIKMVRRTGYPQPRLGLRGSNGRITYYLIQTVSGMNSSSKADQPIVQMMTLLNAMLDRNPQANKRALKFKLPVVIPVHVRTRLHIESAGCLSLEEIYHNHLNERRVDPAGIIPPRLFSHFDSKAERVRAFESLCASHVSPHILSKELWKLCGSALENHEMRCTFAKHLALSSLLSYLLTGGPRGAGKVVLDTSDCCSIFDYDMSPKYELSSTGVLSPVTDLPFRLTRNIEHYLSPAGICGVFANTLLIASSCLNQNEVALSSYLDIFLRDDLVSWNISRSSREVSDTRPLYQSKKLHQHIQANRAEIMRRLADLVCDADQETENTTANGDYVFLPAQLASSFSEKEVKPIDSRIHEMIVQSTDVEKLAMKEATWLPWF